MYLLKAQQIVSFLDDGDELDPQCSDTHPIEQKGAGPVETPGGYLYTNLHTLIHFTVITRQELPLTAVPWVIWSGSQEA